MSRGRLRIAGGLLAVALAGACASAPSPRPVVEAFDFDWSVRTLDGGLLELGALRGDVLVVNVWATWCPPCVAELASFERLSERVGAEGTEVAFLFVSPESREVVARFVAREDFDLPFVLEERRIPDSLGPLVLPTTYIVARDGSVALRHRGASDWDRPEVARLLRSLAEAER